MIDASQWSIAKRATAELVEALGPEGARQAIRVLCKRLTPLERASLAARWRFWARPKQLPPDTMWRSWGLLAGRGFGKTRSCSEYIVSEIEAGRVTSLGLCAQNEEKSIEIYVDGPTGLVKGSPPWFKPKWEASKKTLTWPNGATGIIRTPEAPGAIRSGEHEMCWLSELQSWPTVTREEAFSNFQFATRVGYARMIWDATAKLGHPILIALIAASKLDPNRFIVVNGSMRENALNLASGVVEDLERMYAGTQKGREELDGEMLEEGERAVAKGAWISAHRRPMPERFIRRGIGVDPAVSKRRQSDTTGIIEAGRGVDGQGYVIADHSGRHAPPEWAKIVLDTYVAKHCDVVTVERNKGGDLVVAVLRAFAEKEKLSVIVLPKESAVPPHTPGIVYVKEIHASGDKRDRAQPLSTAYERGRISHVIGAELDSLEITLRTWRPGPSSDSPGDLDALVHIMTELLELDVEVPAASPEDAIAAAIAMSRGMMQASGSVEKEDEDEDADAVARNLAILLGGGGNDTI